MGKKKQILQLKKADSYDGIKLKVYNSGSDGDRVVLKVTWQIQQLLNLYSDIAVLNWFPISDWDKGFGQVDFTVDGLDASQWRALRSRWLFWKKTHMLNVLLQVIRFM